MARRKAERKVVYLDFGTAHLHLAGPQGHWSGRPMVARCGVGAALPMDAQPPGSFKDLPGLFSGEMCKRCLELDPMGESDG